MKINRRSFVIGASGIAASPLISNSLIQTASGAESLIFMADSEVDDFSDYNSSNPPCITPIKKSGNTPVITSERSRAGNKSQRMYLNRLTSSSSYRTEASCTHETLEFFKTHWIGFSIYVPSSWEVSRSWEVLWQLHHDPIDWETYPGGYSPILAIRINSKGNKWLLRQDYVQTPESQHRTSDRRTAFKEEHGTIEKGKWTDWVIEYRPDWRSLSSGGTGVTRFWRDGVLVRDYQGPNAVNAAKTGFIKFGPYKSGWKDRNYDNDIEERLYYYDEFRVSRGDEGSYDLVAPGGTQSQAIKPMPPVLVTES